MSEMLNGKNYCNRQCENFPCHKDADADNFSCLFCYCPLYPLKKCGGNYTYNKSGEKDCSACTMPHDPANYEKLMKGAEKVRKTFTDGKKQRRRRFAVCLVLALVVGALCTLLPVALLQNAWRITEPMDMPDVTQVLAQLQDTNITYAWLPGAVCALISFLLFIRLHRNKIIAAVLALIVFALCLPAALMLTGSNGVPTYTIVQILLEYVSLGAI